MSKKEKYKYDGFISYLQNPDKQLAIAIREGLMRLGAKKYLLKFRALEIFRDEASAVGIGNLTQRLQDGIKNSKYLILVARPEICRPSTIELKNWVYEEIEHWIKTKHSKEFEKMQVLSDFKIVICVVDGKIKWEIKDFDWNNTNCLNTILKGKFDQMPKWVDFRSINSRFFQNNEIEKKSLLTLEDPEFLQKIAEVSAELQGKSVDNLIAEDRKQQLLWSGILGVASIVLIILLGLAIFLGIKSYKNEKRALEKEQEAIKNSDEAKANLRDFKIEKFQRDLRNAEVYLSAQEFCLAKELYLAADSTSRNPEYQEHPIIKEQRKNLAIALDSCTKHCKK